MTAGLPELLALRKAVPFSQSFTQSVFEKQLFYKQSAMLEQSIHGFLLPRCRLEGEKERGVALKHVPSGR